MPSIFDFSPVPHGTHSLSPTDVTTFTRLNQCERYLRLRLHERHAGLEFMKEFGVVPQSITPLLRFSGSEFENEVEIQISVGKVQNCADGDVSSRTRESDNNRVLDTLSRLKNGDTLVLLQPRIEAVVDGWKLRGDIDILRLSRNADGALRIFIADMKSSATPKVEHRLQVAFYHQMLRALLEEHCPNETPIFDLGILYRGDEDNDTADAVTIELRQKHHHAAQQEFGVENAFLEVIENKESYLDSVHDLVTGQNSVAARVAAQEFQSVPFHLDRKCDGCNYQEFCLKWSAQNDDLSLVPHLTMQDKSALQRNGIITVEQLAQLKQRASANTGDEGSLPSRVSDLVASPGQETLVRSVASTWPIGARIDELVHRAQRYRKWKGDDLPVVQNIPSKGYGSLPYCDAEHDPNLVRIYIDSQHDYLHDRIYMLGARVVACENGTIAQSRNIVHICDAPLGQIGQRANQSSTQDKQEAQLFLRWSEELLQTVYELAAPDENGDKAAPIHLIFWDGSEQQMLLEGLGRHASTILAATPLYDFVTQMAAFDSPVVSLLEQEIRELKNYPLVAQTLQSVSEHLFFDWNSPHAFRELFYERHFDAWGKLEWDELRAGDSVPWFTRRARFRSSIPLEYAYAAWNALPTVEEGRDDFAPFRDVDMSTLKAFQERRLEAMEHIANDFPGNRQTYKKKFVLNDLADFECKAANVAQALDEFVIIERHVELAAWKKARLAPPERRMVAGDTFVVRYLEEDQSQQIAERNNENKVRKQLHDEWKAANPDAKRRPKDVMDATRWDMTGMQFRLRLDCANADCNLEHALAVSTLRVGERVVLLPRVTQDSRLPENERFDFTPTPRQLLYGMRADIIEIEVERDEKGSVQNVWIVVEIAPSLSGGNSRGFVFGAKFIEPLNDGQCYTLDSDSDDWHGQHCSQVTQELCSGASSVLLERLQDLASAQMHWPEAAKQA